MGEKLKVDLGVRRASVQVMALVQSDERIKTELHRLFERVEAHDWGLLDDHDKAVNDAAAAAGSGLILAEFEVDWFDDDDPRLWLMVSGSGIHRFTEALRPDER